MTHPPSVLVSEHKVIPTQFDPLVVHYLLIHLHYVSEFQVKLLHEVYLKQAPVDPSELTKSLTHKHGPLVPSTQALLNVVYSQF